MKPIKQQTENKVIELYTKNNLNCKQISKSLKISSSFCERALKRHNIPIERYRNRRRTNKQLNENYFQEIDSIEKAYYLGFIFADGNIYKPKKGSHSWKLSIEIHEKDKEILESFTIGNKINYNPKHNSVYMCIISNKICTDLMKYNITPNKSLTCIFPIIPQQFISHFIRGYFDGDGCISLNKSNNGKRVIIVGTELFLKDILYHSNIKGTVKKHGTANIFELRIYKKKDITDFSDYIYQNHNNILLKRKFSKFVSSP